MKQLQLIPKLQGSGNAPFSLFVDMHQAGKEACKDAAFKDIFSLGMTEGAASPSAHIPLLRQEPQNKDPDSTCYVFPTQLEATVSDIKSNEIILPCCENADIRICEVHSVRKITLELTKKSIILY